MIIVVDAKNPFAQQVFEGLGTVRVLSTADMTAKNVRDAGAIIVRSETRVDRSLLEGSAVTFVGTATIGVDHVDQEYLRKAGIAFAFAPGSNANSVAEYVLSSLLVIATRTHRPLHTLSLGIVGVGNVGSRVARMASAFDMTVLQNDPPLARTNPSGPFVDLDRLMTCDVITIHVPLTRSGIDATYHLFDDQRIRRMKPDAFLINTSRGAVVDGTSLHAALSDSRLGGAVLDVWEDEPSIDASLLRRVTIGTPHIAGYSYDGKLNAVRMMRRALESHIGRTATAEVRNPEPPLDAPVIEAPRTHTPSLEFGVLDVTRHCYDICDDDRALRAMMEVSAGERPNYFRRLRAEYPVRREFGNYSVALSPDEVKMHSVLAALGFHVTQHHH